jgi:hypothetical protein
MRACKTPQEYIWIVSAKGSTRAMPDVSHPDHADGFEDLDLPLAHAKAPGLRIVSVGRKRGEADHRLQSALAGNGARNAAIAEA